MAEQNTDYTNQDVDKLFNSAMFGFNKEEVLEYLEELAEENVQRQETAERRIQELTQRINQLEAGGASGSLFNNDAINPQLEAQLQAQTKELDDMHQHQEALQAQIGEIQKENAWLRDEYRKAEENTAYLAQQLQRAQQQSREGADNGQAAQLQQHLEQAENEIDRLQGLLQQAGQEVALLREQPQQAPENSYWAVQAAQLQQQLQLAEQEIQSLRQGHPPAGTNEALQTIYAQLQQAEDEIDRLNTLLTKEQTTQNSDIEALRGQLNDADLDILDLQKHLQLADEDIAELERQLDDALSRPNQDTAIAAQRQAAAILAEANAEAERLRTEAVAERELLHRQIKQSANGLSISLKNLYGEVSDVESGMTHSLETMQRTLSEILVALSRTEHNLTTFENQVERFPATSPPVAKTPRQLVLFQPEKLSSSDTSQPERKKTAKGGAFQPTFSTSSTAPAPAAWNQAELLDQPEPEAEEEHDDRLRNLSDSLVDTLRQIIEEK